MTARVRKSNNSVKKNIHFGRRPPKFWGPRFDTNEPIGKSGTGPGGQVGACESLKVPMALSIYVLFIWGGVGEVVWGYFQLFLLYLEILLCKIHLYFWMGPKAVLFCLEIISWRPWLHVVCNTLTLLFHQTFIIYILGTKPGIFFCRYKLSFLKWQFQ